MATIDDLIDDFTKKQEKITKKNKVAIAILATLIVSILLTIVLTPLWMLTEIITNIVRWF